MWYEEFCDRFNPGFETHFVSRINKFGTDLHPKFYDYILPVYIYFTGFGSMYTVIANFCSGCGLGILTLLHNSKPPCCAIILRK